MDFVEILQENVFLGDTSCENWPGLVQSACVLLWLRHPHGGRCKTRHFSVFLEGDNASLRGMWHSMAFHFFTMCQTGSTITCGSIIQSLAAVFKKSLAAVLAQCKPITCGSISPCKPITCGSISPCKPIPCGSIPTSDTHSPRRATTPLGFISCCT